MAEIPPRDAGEGTAKTDTTESSTTPTETSDATESSAKTGSRSSTKVPWSKELEALYGSWHRRVAAAEIGHRQMSGRMQRRYLLLGVPVVVLTTVVGTSVFASLQRSTSSGDTTWPTWGSLVIATISIAAAVLSSLQTFLRYSARAEGHRIAAIRYESLRRDMATTLHLPPNKRPDALRELDGVRTRMDRYAKESPMIGQRQWQRLAPKLGLPRVPEDVPWPRGAAWPDDTITVPDVAAHPTT
jgi:hypothetical protein